MKERASLQEVKGEIQRFLISHGVKVGELDPLVAPNLRLELGDFSTDAPLRLLRAGVKGTEQEQAVAELIRRLEALGCEFVQDVKTSPVSMVGFGYLNFRLSCLGAKIARVKPGSERGVGVRVVVVSPTAGLESRVKGGELEAEVGTKGGVGVRAGCNGSAYLRTVARGLVQALLLREHYPGLEVELFLGEQKVVVDGLDVKRAGEILWALARDPERERRAISQEQALAVLEGQIRAGARAGVAAGVEGETHVWLSAHSFLPELFKRFFGQHGGKARFHFSAASWDEAAGIAEIPQELLEIGSERADNAVELGVGLLWCLANEQVAAEFDWYSGVLAEWDNLVWATRLVERRLGRYLEGEGGASGGMGDEEGVFVLPEQEEMRAVLLRSLTLPMWIERAALLGEVENFMVVWRDWLNKANRFLNQPATGTLPNEWHDILPSLKVGLSVTMEVS